MKQDYDICETCSSYKNDQYILGIRALFSKHNNMEQNHKVWLNYMENLPQSTKDILVMNE